MGGKKNSWQDASHMPSCDTSEEGGSAAETCQEGKTNEKPLSFSPQVQTQAEKKMASVQELLCVIQRHASSAGGWLLKAPLAAIYDARCGRSISLFFKKNLLILNPATF